MWAGYGVWNIFALLGVLLAMASNQDDPGAAPYVAWSLIILGVVLGIVTYIVLTRGYAVVVLDTPQVRAAVGIGMGTAFTIGAIMFLAALLIAFSIYVICVAIIMAALGAALSK